MGRLFTFLFLLCVSTLTFGERCQSGFAPQFRQLSIEQGLSQSVVTAIQEDAYGYMWIGTQEGLNRFDGVGFGVWARKFNRGKALPDNHITALALGSDGTLWIGTTKGLAFKQPNHEDIQNLESSEPLVSDYVLSLHVDGSGRLWAGTIKGVFLLDPKTMKVVVWAGQGGRELADTHGRALLVDSRHMLWLGTANGLYRINLQTDSWDEHKYLAGVNISGVIETRDRQLIVSSGKDIYTASSDKPIFALSSWKMPGKEIQEMMEDADGRLWVATDNGVLIKNESEHCVLQRDTMDATSLSNNDVMSLHSDKNGIVWLGTYAGGVNYWPTANARFQHHLIPWRIEGKIKNNTVMAITRDFSNNMWFGLAGGGLVKKRGRTIEPIKINTLASAVTLPTVQTLLTDKNGDLWIGTFGEGLIRRTPSGDETHWRYQRDNINSLSSNYIRVLYEDHAGELWVGTEAGIDKVILSAEDEITFQRLGDQLPPSLLSRSREINAIVEDYFGQLWIGGQGGLVMMTPTREKMTLFQNVPNDVTSLSHTAVSTLSLGHNGDIWVGTLEGFNRIERNVAGQYTVVRDGFSLASNLAIFGVLPGLDGDIWISTSTGLFRHNVEQQYAIQYRRAQGLPSDEFNFGAAYMSKDGELIFGSINGAVSFYPQSVARIRSDAKVVLADYREYDQSIPLPAAKEEAQSLVVDVGTSILSFDYAVLDYADPVRNKLRYRVNGLHENWINLIRTRTVALSGLEPGRYVLEVQGSSATGIWSNHIHQTHLTVRGRFWSIHMVYATAIIALVFLSLASLLYVRRTQKRHQRQLADTLARVSSETASLSKSNAEYLRRYQQQAELVDSQDQRLLELQQRLLNAQHEDVLTGVPSRRFLVPLLTEVRMKVQPRCIVLVDIDGLSYLNEQFGFDSGDKILIQFAQLLKTICREDDIVIRWDGGSFLLVCNVDTIMEVRALCERIKSRVLQHAFMIAERRHADITCSIGFGAWPLCLSDSDARDWQSSINVAEEALHLAKHFGRNCWFGFYIDSDNEIQGDKKLMTRSTIIDLLESRVLQVASSMTIPNNLLEAWPKR